MLIHRTEQERRAGVAAWVARGLEQGAKIVYVETAEQSSDRPLMEVLQDQSVPAEDAVASGQLEVLTPEEVACESRLEELVGRALAGGYPCFRVGGEVATAQTVMSRDDHVELERVVERLCHDWPMGALCQYTEAEVRTVLPTATALHRDGIRHPQLQTMRRPDGIALAGEVDLCDHLVLCSALMAATSSAAASAAGSVVVDLSRLEFLDVSGGRALLRGTAEYRRDGGQVRLRSPQPAVDRLLDLLAMDREPGFTVEEASA